MAQPYQANSNDAQADHVMEEKAQSVEIDALENGPNGSLTSDAVPNNGVQASLGGGQVPKARGFISCKPEVFENVAQSSGEKKGGAVARENTVPHGQNQNNGLQSPWVYPRSFGPPENRAFAPRDAPQENPNIRMPRFAPVSRGYGAYGRGNAQARGRGLTTRGIAQARGRGFAAPGYRGQAGSGSQRQVLKMHHRVTKEELEAKIELMKLLYGEDHYLVIKYESYLISLRDYPANFTFLIYDTYVSHDM